MRFPDWLEVPVDRITETETLEAEKIKFTFTNAIGLFNYSLCRARAISI